MRFGSFAVLFAASTLLVSAVPLPSPMKGPATHAAWEAHHRSEAATLAASAKQHGDVAQHLEDHAWRLQAAGHDNSSQVRTAESYRRLSNEHADAAAEHRRLANWHSQQNPKLLWSPRQTRSIHELD
ncbi:hypothetical protein PIIN_05851 [Serendipita indica DSM 11827]|uniref:Uncharacterized protein n=1 Tax=Serendipita indica (strain DSM 11827) TaxID=1109443 RepID=G4TKS3_SERID|nr:hypothetical protein PIIN_05851 [Serendipita indica DSM 11827]